MITKPFLRNLATKGHLLKPVILIGNKGLTENVSEEIEGALIAHELIKIQISAGTRDDRKVMVKKILDDHKATLVQEIGHRLVIFRASEE